MTVVDIPELALVVLVGISGSGKSTFARRHFAASQVLSSDTFRAMVADDENDQSASGDAFDVLHYVAAKRLRAGRLSVVDATNVQAHARAGLITVAREHDVLPVAIVLDIPEPVCWERTRVRPDRDFGRDVLKRQHRDLRRSLGQLRREGFRKIHVLDDTEDVEIRYEKLFNDRRELTGPFDVISDVHGCRDELEALLVTLGWVFTSDGPSPVHPDGRTALFVGDLVDRGPDSPGVLRLVMDMISRGVALCVAGNHEAKLLKYLAGRKVTVSHGLAETIAQLEQDPIDGLARFLDGLISHYVLDGGNLVVAHAGLKAEYHGRASGRVRSFAMYGDTTGETDEYGLPVRYPWANDYRGKAMVVYGHTPTVTLEWVNNTICLDTGAVFGGRLTALRYPERELVSVPALRQYYQPARPLMPAEPMKPGAMNAVNALNTVNLADVTGRRHVTTDYGTITIPAEHGAAALEVMSRFAVDPRWLLWLPPTMAPSSTSTVDGWLEHPVEAIDDLRRTGTGKVVCEEKHMGSRAVVLVGRDQAAAAKRFVDDGATGVVYTRTGRSFFDPARTEELLGTVRTAITEAGLWDEFDTDWLLLDCELLPWSAKAESLIRAYAGVGAAGRAALPAAVSVLEQAAARGLDVTALRQRVSSDLTALHAYTAAYRPYVSQAPVTLAPFAVLAAQGIAFTDRDHEWQLSIADRLVAVDPATFTPTRRLVLDLACEDATARATQWWLEFTAAGAEGMVVKPHDGLAARNGKGLFQPGIKCRGREYLRIIYGPSYTEPARLASLRERRLGRKRSLALREHTLGLAALTTVAGNGPFHRVHELVFAILACESEPVDPRL